MPFNQGHALLVGVGTHQFHPTLDVPITVADAKAVAAVLQDAHTCGYPAAQVTLIHNENATKAGILGALDDLAGRVGPEGTLLLFYCGHGALGTDGNYYLVSHDAHIEDGRVVAGSGVSEGELLEKLRAIQAQRMLVILNACFSGTMSPALGGSPESLQASTPPEESVMALLSTGQGRIIITACRAEQVSYIGLGENTFFTQALVDGLRGRGVQNSNGFISAFSLYEQIYHTVTSLVSEQVHAKQEPELTVLKGVGPFAVALYKGATTLGDFETNQPLPEDVAVREVAEAQSQRYLKQRVQIRGQSGGVQIGNVRGGIHGSIIAGGDVKDATLGRGAAATPADKE